jgi:hypothetical protein
VYSYVDRRVPTSEIGPNFKSASLDLRTDGTVLQACDFRDGKRYEGRATWSYDGDGNVFIKPLKDCSWVYDDRDGPLEVPQKAASLIVEWGRKPVILMHPDVNAFYEHQ